MEVGGTQLETIDDGSAGVKPTWRHRLEKIISAIAVSIAAVTGAATSGCAETNDSQVKLLEDQVAELRSNLNYCQEQVPDLSHEAVILSYGTSGVRWLMSDNEIRFTVSKAQEKVEFTFVIWPPVSNASDIIVEGNSKNYQKVQVGSNWEVVYKSNDAKPKESLVIEVNHKRYVIFFERK